MKIVIEKYKKVADFCYELFKIAGLTLHNSKFSNKMYSNFQKLFLLIYKQFRRFTYEELLVDLESNVDLKAYLGLNKLPHYTTLIKFTQRLPAKVIDKLIISFREIIKSPEKVAIDATGITLDNASPHYCKRLGRPYKKRPFMKSTFIVDVDNYLILLCKLRKSRRHDTMEAKPMIKKMQGLYNPCIFYADRGYDDEDVFKLVFEKLDAYPLIYQKNQDVPKHRKSGRYRKMTCDVFDYGEYLQRNKIETLNSMFKKRFGSGTRSKLWHTQKLEIMMRIVAFNIDRLIRIGYEVMLILWIRIRVSH